MKTIAVILISCCLAVKARAQQFIPRRGIGVNTSAGFSYTGINTFLTPAFYLGRHCIYAGPQLSLSRSYFFSSGIWGINAGYKYTVLAEKRWSAAVMLDLQSFCTTPYNPYGLPVRNRNTVRELQLGLGLYYHPGRLWHIGLELGAGMVRERFEDVIEQESRVSTGMSQLVRLNTGIFLWRK